MIGSEFKSILFILLLLPLTNTFSQSKDELERKKKQLLEEIKQAEQEVQAVNSKLEKTQVRIEKLDLLISRRQELINDMCLSIDRLDNETLATQSNASELQRELDRVRSDYKNIMQSAYRRHLRNRSTLAWFSYKSLNIALRWWMYLKQFDQYVCNRIRNIASNHTGLMDKIYQLESTRSSKLQLVKDQENQQSSLEREMQTKNVLMAEIQDSQKDLLAEISRKEAQRQKLDKQLADAIKREIEAAKKTSKISKTTKNTKTDNKKTDNKAELKNSPANDPVSKSFAANKGKYAWPVDKASLLSGSGRQSHPLDKNVKVNNKGIYLATSPNAKVKTIFEGTVVFVVQMPSFQNCVLVKHGDYFTFYANLATVNVAKGQKLKSKDTLGTAGVETSYNKSAVLFGVYKGTEELNPESWLSGL
jgi:septal ring factor EnvC (AmiA/AmiB activator)